MRRVGCVGSVGLCGLWPRAVRPVLRYNAALKRCEASVGPFAWGSCEVCVRGAGEGRKLDLAYLLHVVHVASVEILFVQPEKNIELRCHGAYFRVKVMFNPCLLKLALRFLLIKVQLKFKRAQTVTVVEVDDLKGLLNQGLCKPPAEF